MATLETARLVLRPIARTDVPAIRKHFPHWEIVKYLTSAVPWPYPDDGAEKYLDTFLPKVAAGIDHIWGIRLKAHLGDSLRDEVIGIVHFHGADPADPEDVPTRGFWLAREHQGKGYMTEAVFAVNSYIFDVLGVPRLVIKNARDNIGSRRVKEKTGAVLIGVEPSAGKYLGDYAEQEVWELTAENFRRARDAAGKTGQGAT